MNSKINASWHLKNKMPNNPSEKERLKWHAAHMKNCSCRKPSEKLMAQMQEKGYL